jgi:hypothetical protein
MFVRFDEREDARSFVRAIRRRGWNARRKGRAVYVVIGDRFSLDLLVRQWAERVGREPRYTVEM